MLLRGYDRYVRQRSALQIKGIGYGNLNLYPTVISYSVDCINWIKYDESLKLYNLDKDVKFINICGPRKMTAFIKDESESLEKRNLPLIQSENCAYIYRLNIEYLKTLKRQQPLYINFKFGEEKCKKLRCKFVPYIVREKCEIYYDDVNDEYCFKIVFDAISQLLLVVKEGLTNIEIFKKLIYSEELVKLHSSNLLDTTKFFNVYLYKPIGNGLFIKYEEPSIIKFPRVLLGKVHLIHKPRCEYDKTTTSLKFSCVFEGIERLFVKFINNTDNSIVYKTSITSEKEFSFNYFVENHLQLRAFFYYNADMSTDVEKEEVKNLFITDVIDIVPIVKKVKTIPDLNTLVNRKFVVKKFITEKNVEIKDIVVKLLFTSVVTISGIKYLCGKLLSSRNEVIKDSMLLSLEDVNDQYAVGSLYRIKDDKMLRIKKNGVKIVKAMIRIYGGNNGKEV